MGVVAGGFLPAELRGTKNFATIHVADWCECSNGLPHHPVDSCLAPFLHTF